MTRLCDVDARRAGEKILLLNNKGILAFFGKNCKRKRPQIMGPF
jgi:hypothetical protein